MVLQGVVILAGNRTCSNPRFPVHQRAAEGPISLNEFGARSSSVITKTRQQLANKIAVLGLFFGFLKTETATKLKKQFGI